MKDALVQLRLALARFEAERRTINLFFRDDDVDQDEALLRSLLGVFLRHEVPVNLAVIPGLLNDAAITLLREYHSRRPDLFEINQHGWRHTNHERSGRKCEFGESRSFTEQLADIAQGKQTLEHYFDTAFSAVFIPPWNRCTTETWRALDQLRFQALSKLRSKQPVSGYNLRELSVTLDLYRWKNGVAMKTPDEIVREIIQQMRGLDFIGVLLHHKVMDEAGFEFLAGLLFELRGYQGIKFHTFQSLLKIA